MVLLSHGGPVNILDSHHDSEGLALVEKMDEFVIHFAKEPPSIPELLEYTVPQPDASAL